MVSLVPTYASACLHEAEVHGIYRDPKTPKVSSVRWWQGELEDIASVRAIVRNVQPDVVYHLASHVTGSRSIEYVLPTLHSNFVSTVNFHSWPVPKLAVTALC